MKPRFNKRNNKRPVLYLLCALLGLAIVSNISTETTSELALTIFLHNETEILDVSPSSNKPSIDDTAITTPTEIHNKQRIVILPGPHKTGTTSIQRNLVDWLNYNLTTSNLPQKWAWPLPIHEFHKRGCVIPESAAYLEQQGFMYWIRALRNDKNLGTRYEHEKCLYKQYSYETFLDLYRNDFYQRWKKGHSLVLATEAIDYVQRPIHIDEIVQQLPWHTNPTTAAGSDSDITVVISYRAPRSDHLISIWHQWYMRMTFTSFLSKAGSRNLKPLESLSMAELFLEKGLQVILMDMSGIKARGYDVSNVVACDILGADCTFDKNFGITTRNRTSAVQNVRKHSSDQFNMTLAQLDRINSAFTNYECNFLALESNENLTILYPKALTDTFQKCKEGLIRITRRELMKELGEIAKTP